MSGKVHEPKVHVLPDENIGGILREYVEFDREAKVGDYVIITHHSYNDDYIGNIYKVIDTDDEGMIDAEGVKAITSHDVFYSDEYKSLAPTEFVVIDGTRYRVIDRKAKVGEKVIVVEDFAYGKVGEIHTIKEVRTHCFEYTTDKTSIMRFDRCLVLKPLHTCNRCGTELGENACTNSTGGPYTDNEYVYKTTLTNLFNTLLDILENTGFTEEQLILLKPQLDYVNEILNTDRNSL
jgi:signal peptidase I